MITWLVFAVTLLLAGSKVFQVGLAADWSWWLVLSPVLALAVVMAAAAVALVLIATLDL